MTPEEKRQFNKMASDLKDAISELNDVQDQYKALSDLYYRDNFIDKYVWQKDTYITGKLGVGGATPVARQASIPPPVGGITQDSQARAAIDAIRQVLINYGFIAP